MKKDHSAAFAAALKASSSKGLSARPKGMKGVKTMKAVKPVKAVKKAK